MSAGERRDEILDAAVTEFARQGLHGTSSERIAERAGVSQPYLFRLFGTKKGLFLAAVNRGFDQVEETFRVAAEGNPENPLEAMSDAYVRMLHDRKALLLQMQAYAACDDAEVAEVVRERFKGVHRLIEQVSGAPVPDVQMFLAQGMLLNVAASMDLPSLFESEAWVRRCLIPLY